MGTQIGIGFSQKIDTQEAANEAALQSKFNLSSDKIDIALIFSTIHYDPHQIVPALQVTLDQTKIIGCSTAGIILSSSIETRGITVLTISSDDMKFGTSLIESLNEHDPRRAGSNLARNALSDFGRHGRQAFLFFVDGQYKDTSTLLVGIQEILGNVFPILGAGSSDDFHFKKTFQIYTAGVPTSGARFAAAMISAGASFNLFPAFFAPLAPFLALRTFLAFLVALAESSPALTSRAVCSTSLPDSCCFFAFLPPLSCGPFLVFLGMIFPLSGCSVM